jgi:hypothetical protein
MVAGAKLTTARGGKRRHACFHRLFHCLSGRCPPTRSNFDETVVPCKPHNRAALAVMYEKVPSSNRSVIETSHNDKNAARLGCSLDSDDAILTLHFIGSTATARANPRLSRTSDVIAVSMQYVGSHVPLIGNSCGDKTAYAVASKQKTGSRLWYTRYLPSDTHFHTKLRCYRSQRLDIHSVNYRPFYGLASVSDAFIQSWDTQSFRAQQVSAHVFFIKGYRER